MSQIAVPPESASDNAGGSGLFEQFLTAATIVFALANLLLVVQWGDYERSRVFMWAGLPALIAMVAVITGSRHIAGLTIGLCLGIGLLGILSVGMRLLPLGMCVLLWHIVRSRRFDQEAFPSGALLLMNLGLLPAVFILIRLLLFR